ncbi:hypothetical protein MTR_2g100295 [Medicago truncatula]|uniref:Uncharacterized protein n=1 Tax=Medicago truncatula TaxID=3880 RepID=A0A072VCK8_MEDTR|nr:hypothetical protein MTR_2g100295 [Medicago truncatula]
MKTKKHKDSDPLFIIGSNILSSIERSLMKKQRGTEENESENGVKGKKEWTTEKMMGDLKQR